MLKKAPAHTHQGANTLPSTHTHDPPVKAPFLCTQMKGFKLLDSGQVSRSNSTCFVLFINLTHPLQDWSKAGQYEQPVAAASVQRRKEPLDRLRENEMSPSSHGYAGPSHTDDAQRHRMTPATIAAKVTPNDANNYSSYKPV